MFFIKNYQVDKCISNLSEKEKKYATYLILASWAGFPILLDQVSKESNTIHKYLSSLFQFLSQEDLNKAIEIDISNNNTNDDKYVDLYYIIEYAVLFYKNSGNYGESGNKKFIPKISKEKLREITPPNIQDLLNDCIEDMYLLEPGKLELGFGPKGVNTYYSPNSITMEENKSVDKVITSKNIKLENTKIIRDDENHRYKSTFIINSNRY